MNRRELLALGGTGLCLASLGGCLSGDSQPAGQDDSDCTSGISIRTEGPLDPESAGREESRPVASLHHFSRHLVLAAEEGDPVTYHARSSPDLREGTVVRVGAEIYRVLVEKTGPFADATGYEYAVETSESIRAAATPGETVEFSALSRPDRTTLLAHLHDPDRDPGEFSGDLLVAYPDAESRERSAFVPEPEYEYLRYGGVVHRVRQTGTRAVRVAPYRVGLEKLADSQAAYGEQVLARRGHRIDPADLSPEAREFLRATMGGSAERCYPLADHVAEAVDALRGDGGSPLPVKYEGEWYEVDFASFDGEVHLRDGT